MHYVEMITQQALTYNVYTRSNVQLVACTTVAKHVLTHMASSQQVAEYSLIAAGCHAYVLKYSIISFA